MLIYTLRLYTGDRAYAETSNTIHVRLLGTKGESKEIKVCGRTLHHNDVPPCFIHCHASLGDLVTVEVRSDCWIFDDQWFCDKITVKTPENEELLFPCYCWLSTKEGLSLRPASGKLPFQDTHPIAYKQRQKELEEAHEIFRWRVYAEGLPQTVAADSFCDLPAEVQFSVMKAVEFFTTALIELCALGLKEYADSTKPWRSFSEMEKTISESFSPSQTYEYVQKHWKEDQFFGYQLLNGLNPMMIQRCSKLPENFPVSEEMVKDSLNGRTLKHELEKGNIFLCDYKMLDGLVGNVVHDRQQYLTAPLVLLHCNPQGLMLPIAIQVRQTPGPENPIFLPTDSNHDWLLAKIFVRAAEFSVHELDFHLLRTHLLSEVFTMATLRNLPSIHPLFKLIFPHIRYTLHINILARNKLISKDGPLSKYSGTGGESLPKLLRRATSSLTYSSLCLPENISERGLEDVPNYYYRDDGMKLWNIIHKYVKGILTHYYKSDDYVQRDTELQEWIFDIFVCGFLGNDSTRIPQYFKTVEDLIKFVTMVIFTASAQHASVNNGQFDFGGWMPNFPSALRKPPPKEKGQTTEDTIMETLPDKGTTVNIMGILKQLSSDSLDHYPLGTFPEQWFVGDVPPKFIKHFKKDLDELTAHIEKRNAKLELPYIFLNPKNVDNSIAI
ncbi:polyunsaturated fatty acid lipoxygenase ALOX15B-like [Sardina pilchardus]|uniref:polyunsaturated fatty acid lipoxygenase ALOX15B-like n=1 Tax=Sardina pilchardus TaxID=27697 RepID=UPI002E0FCC29